MTRLYYQCACQITSSGVMIIRLTSVIEHNSLCRHEVVQPCYEVELLLG